MCVDLDDLRARAALLAFVDAVLLMEIAVQPLVFLGVLP
jgi:hypothetical protein